MVSGNNYDKISRLYNFLSAVFENSYRAEALHVFSARKDELILEIGFGTGHSLIKLAESVSTDGFITGIDNSASMNKITMKKILKSRWEKNISLICGDVLKEKLEEHYFDGIFMAFTLETFSSEAIEILMKKIQLWLKPDGRLCILCMTESEKKTMVYRMYLWSHKTFPRIVDCRPINPERILKESGFSINKSELLTIYGLPVKIVLASI